MTQRKKYKSYGKKLGKAAGAGTLKDHNIAATDPNKQQFEPTEKHPVRQHVKMAGG